MSARTNGIGLCDVVPETILHVMREFCSVVPETIVHPSARQQFLQSESGPSALAATYRGVGVRLITDGACKDGEVIGCGGVVRGSHGACLMTSEFCSFEDCPSAFNPVAKLEKAYYEK
ncbi:hypothetical protein L195_g019625 [Trifolium pratense]|uniref:Uncharacterized protein n=1 Tax=Trifolium pratense TaxID=57577 RepID=A0A2K3N0A8_TRIPR|nr:hypothetical protein L195_g019625 [Trifolium pratense]